MTQPPVLRSCATPDDGPLHLLHVRASPVVQSALSLEHGGASSPVSCCTLWLQLPWDMRLASCRGRSTSSSYRCLDDLFLRAATAAGVLLVMGLMAQQCFLANFTNYQQGSFMRSSCEISDISLSFKAVPILPERRVSGRPIETSIAMTEMSGLNSGCW